MRRSAVRPRAAGGQGGYREAARRGDYDPAGAGTPRAQPALAEEAPVSDKATPCHILTQNPAVAVAYLVREAIAPKSLKEPVAQPVEQLTFNQ